MFLPASEIAIVCGDETGKNIVPLRQFGHLVRHHLDFRQHSFLAPDAETHERILDQAGIEVVCVSHVNAESFDLESIFFRK